MDAREPRRVTGCRSVTGPSQPGKNFVVPVTVLFIGWYFLYMLVAVFAPGFMRISVIGDVNVGPGIVSIPLAPRSFPSSTVHPS